MKTHREYRKKCWLKSQVFFRIIYALVPWQRREQCARQFTAFEKKQAEAGKAETREAECKKRMEIIRQSRETSIPEWAGQVIYVLKSCLSNGRLYRNLETGTGRGIGLEGSKAALQGNMPGCEIYLGIVQSCIGI